MCSLFKLHKLIVLEDIPQFKKVCMQFMFKKDPRITSLIFAKKEEIFEMNFESERITTLHTFSNPFNIQPSYFVSNNS